MSNYSMMIEGENTPIPNALGQLFEGLSSHSTDMFYGNSGFIIHLKPITNPDKMNTEAFQNTFNEVYSVTERDEPIKGKYYQIADDTWYIISDNDGSVRRYTKKWHTTVLEEPLKLCVVNIVKVKQSHDMAIDDYILHISVKSICKDD